MNYTQNLHMYKPTDDDETIIEQVSTNFETIDTVVGGEVMGTTATTLKGAIAEHSSAIEALENEDHVKTVNGIAPDQNGDIAIDKVAYADNLVADDAQSSAGEFVTRTTGGDASLSDGDAWLNVVRGNRVHTGYVPRDVALTVTPVSTVPRVGTITATVDRDAWVETVDASGTYEFNYTTAWYPNPETYGITVSGAPAYSDSIAVVYAKEVLDMTVNSTAEEDKFTAELDRDTFIEYVNESSTVSLLFEDDAWSESPALYGITIDGTPVDGDSIVITYSKESIEKTVDAVTTVARQNPITATVNAEIFDNAVQSDGVVTFEYSNTWSRDPVSYGITVTNTPMNGDIITVNCTKEVRGTITVFDPDEFYSTNWNIYSHTLGYARTLKYRNPASFILGGTFTSASFSKTNDPGDTKTPVDLVDNGDGTYYFEVTEDGFVWLNGTNNTDTYILMTWSDWTSGLPSGTSFAPHYASTINFTTIMAARFPYGLMRVGGVTDEINLSLQTAYSRIERMTYSAANLTAAKESGRAFEYDENYIYIVKAEADAYAIELDGLYLANDHGLEVFTNTFVPGYAQMLYGQNLKDKLRTDVLTISAQTLSAAQKNQVRNNISAVASVNGKTPNSSGAVTLVPSDIGLTQATMRDVPFAIAVGDWASASGGFKATFNNAYITTTSKEVNITYDSSLRSYAKGDISAAKKSGGGGIEFTTAAKPTGTITGTIYVIDNDDGKIPTLVENTVVQPENGGTGQSSIAGARTTLGVGDITTLKTTSKTSAVAAINEISDQIAQLNIWDSYNITAGEKFTIESTRLQLFSCFAMLSFHAIANSSASSSDVIATVPDAYKPLNNAPCITFNMKRGTSVLNLYCAYATLYPDGTVKQSATSSVQQGDEFQIVILYKWKRI